CATSRSARVFPARMPACHAFIRRARTVDPRAILAAMTRRTHVPDRDERIFELIDAEFARQSGGLELIASENFVSRQVMEAVGSVLTNKYAEGYPGKRYYGGCEVIDQVEQLAIDRAKELFGANWANVQPHSGSNANFAAYYALLEHGDKVLG